MTYGQVQTMSGSSIAAEPRMGGWLKGLAMIVGIFAVLIAAPAAKASAKDPKAEKFISDLAVETLAILSDGNRPRVDRREEFRALMVVHTDFERFGRSALGRQYARTPTADEFKEYLATLEDYAVHVLFAQFVLFADHSVVITRSETRSTANNDYAIVETNIVDPQGRPAAVVQWINRVVDGTYKIFDIRVESTDGKASFSLLTTQRDEFTQVLSKNNGKMTVLIEYLRQGIKRMEEREAEDDADAAKNQSGEAATTGDTAALAQ